MVYLDFNHILYTKYNPVAKGGVSNGLLYIFDTRIFE